MTYMFKINHPFIPPDKNGLIETIPFLEASGEILIVIDFLGPSFLRSAFHRTRDDVAGNIMTLEKKYQSNPIQFHTLNAMLEDEINSTLKPATVALLWLKRSLEFIFHFCQLLISDESEKKNSQDMSKITLQAYGLSLRKFHNFFLAGLFYIVAHILPSRKGFLKLLAGGRDNKEDEVCDELKKFVEGLNPNLQIINKYFIENGMNDTY